MDEELQISQLMNLQGNQKGSNSCYHRLQWCIDKRDLAAGRRVYSLILKGGCEVDAFLGSHLIRMFALCGSLSEANQVFGKISQPSVYTWSSIIVAHIRLGEDEQAIKLYQQMPESGVKPNDYVFVAVLKACTSTSKVHLIHGHIVESGFEMKTFVRNALINVYAKCGSLEDARKIFDTNTPKDVVTWNTMIAGYAHHGHAQEAFVLFKLMQQEDKVPDNVTFVSIFKACSSTAALDQGKIFHGLIIERGLEWNAHIGSSLIDMYAKCGWLQDAQTVFDLLSKRDIVIWGALIAGYAQNGQVARAVHLFLEMQWQAIEPNNALWNILIAGYAHSGQYEQAHWLFHQMQLNGRKPDSITFVSILKACSGMAALDQGKLIHADINKNAFESDVYVGSAVLDMYIKCGSLEDAGRVFAKLPVRDLVTWNAMITGYYLHGWCDEANQLFQGMQKENVEPDIMTWNAMIDGNAEHGHGKEALCLFKQMQQAGIQPDSFTFASVLKACLSMVALAQGKLIHVNIIESGFEADVTVSNILIAMYAKCGSLENACIIFDRFPHRELVTWNAMISGCALHNDHDLAFQYLEDMQQDGLKPDDATLVCLLSACSHIGQVDKGCLIFKSMMKDDDRAPTIDHYNCLVDIFGRAGCLTEAEDLLQTMPFQPNIVSWTSLLSNCKLYGDVDLGRRCFDIIFVLRERYASWYALMENLYDGAGMWMEANKIQMLKKCADSWNKPGKAFIEIDSNVYEFIVGDRSHPNNDDIYAKLKRICVQLEGEGLMPRLDSVVHPITREMVSLGMLNIK